MYRVTTNSKNEGSCIFKNNLHYSHKFIYCLKNQVKMHIMFVHYPLLNILFCTIFDLSFIWNIFGMFYVFSLCRSHCNVIICRFISWFFFVVAARLAFIYYKRGDRRVYPSKTPPSPCIRMLVQHGAQFSNDFNGILNVSANEGVKDVEWRRSFVQGGRGWMSKEPDTHLCLLLASLHRTKNVGSIINLNLLCLSDS